MTIKYSNELHAHYLERTRHSSARIVPLVLEWLAPRSVVDVGCGHGHWLKPFVDAGIADVRGMDGAYVDTNQLVFPREKFQVVDLNAPPAADRRFDLAISLEVAEHLNPASSEPFVSLLTSLSDCILFSAAVPGQPGNDHINARWPGYWRKRFAAHGYVALDGLRPRIWHDEAVMMCYRQNTMLMVREARLPDFPALSGMPRVNCLTLVDEEAMDYYVKQQLPRWLRWWRGMMNNEGQ
ncbi:MAG TPA: class I SAM-dependent methyltransferase [Kiritimatiellia bacterium]|nr:class I SAM-dependent methyltransferase [Kiritimatiellia bacterium]HMO98688.1 class I SAM-dependent methyltransferase [Kiritimatiellia bacterium]